MDVKSHFRVDIRIHPPVVFSAMSKKTVSRKPQKKSDPVAPERTYRVMVRLLPEVRASLERLAKKDRRHLSTYASLVLEDHVAAKTGEEPDEIETP